jgi:hypothetical protein
MMEEKTVAITIRMDARKWEDCRQIVLLEKGEALERIEEELARAGAAGDDALINDNPLDAVTRSLVAMVYESDSLCSVYSINNVWDVLCHLVAAADPDCDKSYGLGPKCETDKAHRLAASMVGKRVRIKLAADREEFYHVVTGVTDCCGQAMVRIEGKGGALLPAVLVVHPEDEVHGSIKGGKI